MSKANYSKACFFEFLSYLKAENVQPSATVHQWRLAAVGLLDNLSRDEERDLRRISLDQLVYRFAEKSCRENKSITPWMLHQYKSQLSSAIGDFVAYVINPARYRADRADVAEQNFSIPPTTDTATRSAVAG